MSIILGEFKKKFKTEELLIQEEFCVINNIFKWLRKH